MENSRLVAGSLMGLGSFVRILAARAWWLAALATGCLPRRRPVQLRHAYEEQADSDAA